MQSKPGSLIDLDTVSTAPLPHMQTNMVSTVTTDSSSIDNGAVDRSITVARYLARVGIWDGSSPITISDPYLVHDRLDRWVLVERMNGQTFVRAIDASEVATWGNSPDESEVPNDKASKHTVRDILDLIHSATCHYRKRVPGWSDAHYILEYIRRKEAEARALNPTERIGYKRILDRIRAEAQLSTGDHTKRLRTIERVTADALALPFPAVQS